MPRRASAASEPSGPAIGMWPMRRPVLAPRPRRIISSSAQSVPSKSTSGAPRRRSAERGGQAGAAGDVDRRARRRRVSSTPTVCSPSRSVATVSPLQIEGHLAGHRRTAAPRGPGRARTAPRARPGGGRPASGSRASKIGFAASTARISPVAKSVEPLLLAQRQQAGDVVDVAVGQQHRAERHGARAGGVQRAGRRRAGARMSGEALISAQSRPLPLTAIEDWVMRRDAAGARAARSWRSRSSTAASRRPRRRRG